MYGVCVTGVCCCTTNAGKGWPQFLHAAVGATADGAGVVVGLLVPTETTVLLLGGAAAVNVSVSTDFPFSDSLTVTVVGAPASGPPLRLLLRVPTWATAASTLAVNGGAPQPVAAQPGSGGFAVVPLAQGGASTVARLDIGTEIRVRQWPGANGGVSVHRGALLFSLRLDENVTITKQPWLPAWPNATDYDVRTDSPWNYALVIPDLQNPGAAMTFNQLGAPGPVPFSPDSLPCSITAAARLVPAWTQARDAAGQLPQSPVDCSAAGACGPVVQVTLVPHGSTLLRISTLPFVAA